MRLPLSRRRTPPLDPAPNPAPEPLQDPALATQADIRSCFRLLLGRPPNPEEWAGHAMQAGQNLEQVVAGYLSSLEFSRRNLARPAQASAPVLCNLPGFQIYVQPDDAAVGHYVQADNYEREVTAVFRRLLAPGMAVIDIGANIGYFTMLSASLVGAAGHVLAIEPNPRNVRLLEASRRANQFAQVSVIQAAAGPQPGLLVLHATHSNGTTSALPDSDAAILAAETVPCLPPDLLVPPTRPIGLIKADVEGAEYLALQGCAAILARDRPTLITEFSPSLMPGISGIDGRGYLRWLVHLGYRLSVIAADGSLLPAATEDAVLDSYSARGTDHIDIVATAA